MRVVALIPAYNEADYIVQTITAVASIESVNEIVVINDGSTDGTLGLAMGQKGKVPKKVTVINLKQNHGKGAALNQGIRKTYAQVYLLIDADLGETAQLALGLLDPILRSEADMTIARFGVKQSSSKAKMGFGTVRRTASFGVKMLTGMRVSSPLSGQRAVKSAVLQTLGDFEEGFGVEVALTVGALHHKFEVLEVPLDMKHRAHGRGLKGLRHRGSQLMQVLRALWHCYKRGWHR